MKKQVEFYILNENYTDKVDLFACALIEKIYVPRKRIYVRTQSHEQALRLDELLWTYEPSQFLPHQLKEEGLMPPAPIQLSDAPDCPSNIQIFINLHVDFPVITASLQHIIEIVANEENALQQARERYRLYRQQNMQPQYHDLRKKTEGKHS